MNLITRQQRGEILQTLITAFREDERIVSVILGGSTAAGFTDMLSDIDLVVITDEKHFDSCWKEWSQWFEKEYEIIRSFGGSLGESKRIICYLVHGLLEIDLVFESRNSVSPRKERHIVFDRSGKLEDEFEHMDKQETTGEEKQYHNSLNTVWYNIMRGTAALYRGNAWRAYNETTQLVYKVAELTGIRYRIDTVDLQSIELLPEEFAAEFRKCISPEITLPKLKAAFRESVKLYFKQAEALDVRFDITDGKELGRLMSGYISTFLK